MQQCDSLSGQQWSSMAGSDKIYIVIRIHCLFWAFHGICWQKQSLTYPLRFFIFSLMVLRGMFFIIVIKLFKSQTKCFNETKVAARSWMRWWCTCLCLMNTQLKLHLSQFVYQCGVRVYTTTPTLLPSFLPCSFCLPPSPPHPNFSPHLLLLSET